MQLAYCMWRDDLQVVRFAVHMKKCDVVVLDSNATCANSGDTVCSQLLGVHALTGCDTVSYPFGEGKTAKDIDNIQLVRAVRH